ncbi:MAG: DUF3316 domain-containing protein [Paraprevotella sp.]|nr:DUF3316 domain-containing protein [Paraprevotella sp.]
MKKILHAVVFTLTTFVLPISAKAQEVTDTVAANRYTVHSTMFGLGSTNQLESYLSPFEYTGAQISFLRESLRMTRMAQGRISYQGLFDGYVGCATGPEDDGNELGGSIGYHAGWHYHWTPSAQWRLMAGLQFGGDIGFLYNMRNGNNPAQARARIESAASVAAIYKFHLGRHSLTFRAQTDFPFMGAIFSPNYGQSYYEIFSKGNYDHNICFTHMGNAPSFRGLFTLDFPIGGYIFRVGYNYDIRQSKVNHLKSHVYNHSFLIGYVKHFSFHKHKEKNPNRFIL